VSAPELSELERLHALGEANGVVGLRIIDGAELARLEPHVRAHAAMHSPATGIVDTHGLVKALEGKTRAAGGQVIYRCEVTCVDAAPAGYTLTMHSPAGEERLTGRMVVNAAGLESDRIAALAGVPGYRLHWCKGDYFATSGAAARLVSRLVYPVPTHELTSLGVHVTLDLAGRMRLGPDATYVDRDQVSLDVDPTKAASFCAAVQRFLPELRLEDLDPDTCGIRPKLQGPADEWRDFVIREERAAGSPGLVNLVGIESPGLTASLAIAEEVRFLLQDYT